MSSGSDSDKGVGPRRDFLWRPVDWRPVDRVCGGHILRLSECLSRKPENLKCGSVFRRELGVGTRWDMFSPLHPSDDRMIQALTSLERPVSPNESEHTPDTQNGQATQGNKEYIRHGVSSRDRIGEQNMPSTPYPRQMRGVSGPGMSGIGEKLRAEEPKDSMMP